MSFLGRFVPLYFICIPAKKDGPLSGTSRSDGRGKAAPPAKHPARL